MISPRQTTLYKTPTLRSFQTAIVERACDGDLSSRRQTAVLIPTRAAAVLLQRTIERHRLQSARAVVLPDLLTRDEFYHRQHQRFRPTVRILSPTDREVLFTTAAREVRARGLDPPFPIRPGLMGEMLAFYDELRRNDHSVDDFERLLGGDLTSVNAIDRGAERLFRQTRFLAETFRQYERLVWNSGWTDEHGIREGLLTGATSIHKHVIVTVGDRTVSHGGLWLADFKLLARLQGIERLDIVATSEILRAGFYERLQDILPGISVEDLADEAEASVIMMTPAEDPNASRMDDLPIHFCSRDREEELTTISRIVKWRCRSNSTVRIDRTAIVFQRALPYVYLAKHVLGSAGLPYQTYDALPLAAEPSAAALDLILASLTAGATPESALPLLASPHFRFDVDGTPVTRVEVTELERTLFDIRRTSVEQQRSSLGRLASAEGTTEPVHRAARAALACLADIARIAEEGTASGQFRQLCEFLSARGTVVWQSESDFERTSRARAAILATLHGLWKAHSRWDDFAMTAAEVAATVRHWIERQTFAPRTGNDGLTLIDAASAPFGDFDDLWIVGLVESEWPESPKRSIFYPLNLLAQLGWPKERERLASGQAAFRDLLKLPVQSVWLSSFALEDDAIETPSTLLDELEAISLLRQAVSVPQTIRIFRDEALDDPVGINRLPMKIRDWAKLRLSRTPSVDRRYRGFTGPHIPESYAVRSVESYLDCPFKYFSAHVLRLDDEDTQQRLSPRERGKFVHELLQDCFASLQAERGTCAIRPSDLSGAKDLFERIAERHLDRLPPTDRSIERTRIFGSPSVVGLIDRVLAAELSRSASSIEQLHEFRLDGTFELTDGEGLRSVRLRGTADRLDLCEDGSFRVIDYKLGRAPLRARTVQLPIYSVCAERRLKGYRGRDWRLEEAGYVAFGEAQDFVTMVPRGASKEETLQAGQKRFLDAVGGIEAGIFPPRPAELNLCVTCAYSTVCRKDIVDDE